MDHRDGAPERREPVVWVLTQLRGTALRSLSTHRLSTHSDCWLGGGARILGLLVIPHPVRKFMTRACMKT